MCIRDRHRYHLEAEVYDARSLKAALDFAEHVPDAPAVHIKLDTGMHRLGFMPEEVPTVLDALRGTKKLHVASILSLSLIHISEPTRPY